MNIESILKASFDKHVALYERRPGIFQVQAPLYHEDGDMVDVFLDLPKTDSGLIRVSDHGMTLMRLSYAYELDTPAKKKVFYKTLSENGVSELNGRLYIETSLHRLLPALLQFAQTIAKISNMQAFKRDVVQSLFYETLDSFVLTSLGRYNPEANIAPIVDRNELTVDWRIPLSTRDLYLYGVRDSSKARLVGLTCLELQKASVPFRSVIVHEELETQMSQSDQRLITNIADKQFATLPDFMNDAVKYLEREAAVGAVQ